MKSAKLEAIEYMARNDFAAAKWLWKYAEHKDVPPYIATEMDNAASELMLVSLENFLLKRDAAK